MDLSKHPIWKNVSPLKKPAHFLRIYLARNIVKLYPRSTFVGITGSVGKTTTTTCCYKVLSQKFKTISTVESRVVNLDPIFNIPITILRMKPGVKKVVLEMGIELPGDMDVNLSFVAPAQAVVTRLYYAHSEFLGDINQIYEEKSKLVTQLPEDGVAVLNYDDPYVRKMAESTKSSIWFYGTDPKKCHVWASNIRIEHFQTTFEINYKVERVEVCLKLLGRHQIYAALAAAALGLANGLSLLAIKRGLEQVEPVEHRLNVVWGPNGAMVIDDTYNNASPIGLEAALDVLKEVPSKRKIAVLGEMRELGNFSEELHREIARKIYKDRAVDFLLLGSGDAKYIFDELSELGFPTDRMQEGLSNSQMVSSLLKLASKGDTILIKGSRSTRLDEVVKRINSKGKND